MTALPPLVIPGVWLLEVPSPALLRAQPMSNGDHVALDLVHLSAEYLYFLRIYNPPGPHVQCLTTLRKKINPYMPPDFVLLHLVHCVLLLP